MEDDSEVEDVSSANPQHPFLTPKKRRKKMKGIGPVKQDGCSAGLLFGHSEGEGETWKGNNMLLPWSTSNIEDDYKTVVILADFMLSGENILTCSDQCLVEYIGGFVDNHAMITATRCKYKIRDVFERYVDTLENIPEGAVEIKEVKTPQDEIFDISRRIWRFNYNDRICKQNLYKYMMARTAYEVDDCTYIDIIHRFRAKFLRIRKVKNIPGKELNNLYMTYTQISRKRRFFVVTLKLQNQVLHLLFQKTDAYFVGFKAAEGTWLILDLKEEEKISVRTYLGYIWPAESSIQFLPIGTAYSDLFQGDVELSSCWLGRSALIRCINTMFQYSMHPLEWNKEDAKALLGPYIVPVIIMLPEASRNEKIAKHIQNFYNTRTQLPKLLAKKIYSWTKASKIICRNRFVGSNVFYLDGEEITMHELVSTFILVRGFDKAEFIGW